MVGDPGLFLWSNTKALVNLGFKMRLGGKLRHSDVYISSLPACNEILLLPTSLGFNLIK